ncbi:MAG TPA: hypothetical protein VEI02_00710, partial [Planctomycetota bacterium]|nr:hypothetical protein [Planctomycetota bacterium]
MSQFQGKAPSAFIRRSTFVAAFLLAATAAAPAQFAAQTFTVINGTAQTRTQEPVTFGFPVPKTPAVTSLTGFRIVNAAGQAVPAQFRALTRWGGDRDVATLPLRWVQASFKADAPANGASTYTVSWSSAGPAGTLSVVQTSSTVTVTTGTNTSFVLSKTGFTLFNAATVNGTAILTGAGSLTMQAPGGASIPATSVTTVVEQSGSVSAVVRQNGSLGELRYTCRWTFFAGRSDVVVDFRLENPKCFGVAASNVP